MKNLLVFLSFFIVFFVNAQNSEWKRPEFKEYTLDNGLTVILNEDHLQPLVFGAVVTKAGSKEDPADATGMAHYMEHMLFKGTEEMCTVDWEKERPLIEQTIKLYEDLSKEQDPEKKKAIQLKINDISTQAAAYAIPNEMDKLLKGIGSTDINANTGSDRTMYFNTFPSGQIEKWIEIYSSRFYKPVFRGFQAELEVVYEEKNMYSDMFQFSLFEEFNKVFFKNHPYGQQPLIGTTEHLKNPSLTKMYEFYNNWYVPSNMALVMSGDFNTEEILPLIKEKFGKWENNKSPEKKKWEEKPFTGREYIEKKLTPVKMALLGFKTVPAGDPDELPLEMMSGLLSNSSQTGYFDKLAIDNKLLAAYIFAMPYNDYGQTIMLIVPKLIGQKMEDAEAIVMAELNRIANGDFSDEDVERLKKSKYVEFMQSMESPEDKAVLIAEMFAQGRKYSELYEYPDRVLKINRDDIIKVAKKYFGQDYLALYSKMGFPKKDKIEKPGFKAAKANTEVESPFAIRFKDIPEKTPNYKFIDFDNDIKTSKISEATTLYYAINPINNIFSCTIKFGAGEKKYPLLKYATQLLNLAGAGDKNVTEFKQEMASIGCNYSIYSDESYLFVDIEGIEENRELALKWVMTLLTKPNIAADKIKVIYDGEKTNRKMERSEPDNVADALFDWVRYQNESDYLTRLTLKEIKEMNLDSVKSVIEKVVGYERTIHYCGIVPFDKVSQEFLSYFPKSEKFSKSSSPYVPEIKQYDTNTIFLVDKPKSSQSKIYFLINGEPYKIKEQPMINAFNMYFGGDFSGIVMQYVREYRSMAYSAGAGVAEPKLIGKPSLFYGYIGTQGDKTIEAIALFDSLVRFMPEFPERTAFIKNYLLQSSVSERPSFRRVTRSVERWKMLGCTSDPLKDMLPVYKDLKFNDIVKFEQEKLAKKPMVISIVGNAKQIDQSILSKYGTVVKLKEKQLYRD
ncbi:MAG: hypothetical protein CVU05_10785 [Bacteroidetes bacterium HGW-Bacteroidetes-21]|jgi:predicted Zn-dependent peptidase|nr:MAG: hypothetical protein CVU05_10785 [Bacteroidetes bacterium HGW-Bacteroidetes-21]